MSVVVSLLGGVPPPPVVLNVQGPTWPRTERRVRGQEIPYHNIPGNPQIDNLIRPFKISPTKITKRATVIPSLHGPEGMAYSDFEKAEAFKDTLEVTFQENVEPYSDDKIEEVENVVCNYFDNFTTLTPPLTSPIEVRGIIKRLQNRKAAGPDHIPDIALKYLTLNAITYLTKIYYQCLIKNHFPTQWKQANVVMLPKPNQDHKFSQNYRPISLLSTTAKLQDWLTQWRIAINVDKSQAIIFRKWGVIDHPFQLTLFEDNIQWVSVVRYLGLHMDSRLTYKKHIDYLSEKFWGRIHLAISLVGRMSPLSLENKVILYKQVLRPIITYASPVWGAAAATHMKKIQVIQNKILRLITNAPWYVRNDVIHFDLHMEPISSYITKLARNVFRTIENHDNPIIRAQTMFTYPYSKLKYAYATAKWQLPLKPP
ncbi:RNA-directed DNA polymerase from mobile element jockey [Trichonephila clavipes]|nr:RNA-directed DNA polymerase from mobile element jockey [Trichonephila clavipes]